MKGLSNPSALTGPCEVWFNFKASHFLTNFEIDGEGISRKIGHRLMSLDLSGDK